VQANDVPIGSGAAGGAVGKKGAKRPGLLPK
jgi:hypothetical protein